jgi:hypothetical protein
MPYIEVTELKKKDGYALQISFFYIFYFYLPLFFLTPFSSLLLFFSFPLYTLLEMTTDNDFGNPLKKFKLVFLGEQSGELCK